MKKTLTLTILVLWLLSQSCLKDKVKKKVYLYPDEYLMQHYDFKKGTYWIYRDIKTGDLDSFIVDSILWDTSRANTTQKEEYYFVRKNMFIDEYVNGLNYDSTIWRFCLYGSIFSQTTNLGGGTGVGGVCMLLNNNKVNATVQGINYVDVTEYCTIPPYLIKEYIGFIRFSRYSMILNDTTNVWELMRYNIK